MPRRTKNFMKNPPPPSPDDKLPAENPNARLNHNSTPPPTTTPLPKKRKFPKLPSCYSFPSFTFTRTPKRKTPTPATTSRPENTKFPKVPSFDLSFASHPVTPPISPRPDPPPPFPTPPSQEPGNTNFQRSQALAPSPSLPLSSRPPEPLWPFRHPYDPSQSGICAPTPNH